MLFQGSYSYQFNTAGTYYVWSGYVNNQLFSFRGIIQVNNAVDKYLNLNVALNGFQGKYFLNIFKDT